MGAGRLFIHASQFTSKVRILSQGQGASEVRLGGNKEKRHAFRKHCTHTWGIVQVQKPLPHLFSEEVTFNIYHQCLTHLPCDFAHGGYNLYNCVSCVIPNCSPILEPTVLFIL